MEQQGQTFDLEQLKAEIAKYERKKIVERMQRGKQAAKERRAAEKVQAEKAA